MFGARTQLSGSVNRSGEGLHVHVKGAPERVLTMCGGVDRDGVLVEVERLAAEGFRVIAVAAGDLDQWVGADDAASLGSLEFLGLCGLIDPLRSEAAKAVARCGEAGVQVRMVTGDHPVTALAIAGELGLDADRTHVVRGPSGTTWASHLNNRASLPTAERRAGRPPSTRAQMVLTTASGGVPLRERMRSKLAR